MACSVEVVDGLNKITMKIRRTEYYKGINEIRPR